MRYSVAIVVAAMTLGSTTWAAPPAADEQNALVIVFKDGHQQTISMADVARIEFKTASNAGRTSFAGRGRFLGKWKVGDGAGGHFFITLEPSGDASKSMGTSHGTWTVVDGEARISWDDGWHDAIRKVGDKYQKAAFSPGTSFSDNPSNVADAVNTSPQPN
jgi:hypothetical protein